MGNSTEIYRNFMVNDLFVLPSETLISPMGGGSYRVSPRGQQSPVVSSTSRGDVVVYLLHTNGCIGNSCTIPYVRDSALYSPVDLQRHITTQMWVDAKLREVRRKCRVTLRFVFITWCINWSKPRRFCSQYLGRFLAIGYFTQPSSMVTSKQLVFK